MAGGEVSDSVGLRDGRAAPKVHTSRAASGPAGGGLSFAAWWLDLAGVQRRRGEHEEHALALHHAALFRQVFTARGGWLP